MTANEPVNSPSYDTLLQQNLALRQELDELKSEWAVIWPMLVEISRRLQVSSASIKAAVSSLLSYDIFWDVANQHEFLETIDTSADHVSQLLMLLSFAFRLEAESLEIKREPQALQEIIAGVQAGGTKRFPKLSLELSMPPVDKSIWVDYRHLMIALSLLFEVIEARLGRSKLLIRLYEGPQEWYLEIDGQDAKTVQGIQELGNCLVDLDSADKSLSPENRLKLHITCKLFHLLGMRVEAVSEPDEKASLRLLFPATGDE